MVTNKLIDVNGAELEGTLITAPGGEGHPNMIVIAGSKGYLMCGYLNIEKAESFGDAAVLVGGADFDAVLAGQIRGMTPQAAALGVKEGMTGAEAAAVLA